MPVAVGSYRMSAELSIVVPTYRERENIGPLHAALERALAGVAWELIFVDDDSDDGSAAEFDALCRRDSRVRCLRRIGRRGLSSACIEGIRSGSAQFVCIMDADLQHDESLLPQMLALLRSEECELVIGSRYLPRGSTGGLPPARVLVSRVATWLSRLLSGVRVSDPMSGFFMFRRGLFDDVADRLYGRGFKILLDMLLSSRRIVACRELPYVMRSRAHGHSKLSAAAVWDLLILLAHNLLGRLLPARFISFVAVGSGGLVLHMVVLWLLHRVGEGGFLLAQAVATLVAMSANFTLNNLLTWGDRRLRGLAYLRGLFGFCMACALGAVLNVAIAAILFRHALPWWLAGLAGAICGAGWNYVVTALLVWRQPQVRR